MSEKPTQEAMLKHLTEAGICNTEECSDEDLNERFCDDVDRQLIEFKALWERVKEIQ